MAIQFVCPSCSNPIEIDDEWASQRVACPFCRNTISAPAASTYDPPSVLPTARATELPAGGPGSAEKQEQGLGRNAFAILGLCLSLAFAGTFLGFNVFVGPKIMESMSGSATMEEAQRHIQQQVLDGNPPAWFMTAVLTMLVGALFWVCGLVCAILGCRMRRGRRIAIAALCILFLGPLYLCCGAMMTGSGASIKPVG